MVEFYVYYENSCENVEKYVLSGNLGEREGKCWRVYFSFIFLCECSGYGSFLVNDVIFVFFFFIEGVIYFFRIFFLFKILYSE